MAWLLFILLIPFAHKVVNWGCCGRWICLIPYRLCLYPIVQLTSSQAKRWKVPSLSSRPSLVTVPASTFRKPPSPTDSEDMHSGVEPETLWVHSGVEPSALPFWHWTKAEPVDGFHSVGPVESLIPTLNIKISGWFQWFHSTSGWTKFEDSLQGRKYRK